jgi:hypothetical protein
MDTLLRRTATENKQTNSMPAVNQMTRNKFTGFVFTSCRVKFGLDNAEL